MSEELPGTYLSRSKPGRVQVDLVKSDGVRLQDAKAVLEILEVPTGLEEEEELVNPWTMDGGLKHRWK